MNKLIAFCLAFCCMQGLKAEIRLPAMVGSHMVLQRDKPIWIWGYGSPGEKLTLSFAGKNSSVVTDSNGKWKLKLPALKAGGPYEMILKGENEIRLQDILIGDVWICSGQSNMEFNLQETLNAEEEMKHANYPNIRLFHVEKKISLQPEIDTRGSWSSCTPEQAKYFPAIGYFFGRKILADVGVPIGLINASWGGTVIESWISADGLKGEPSFGLKAQQVANFDTAAYNAKHRALNKKWVSDFNMQDKGFGNGTYPWATTAGKDWPLVTLPSGWEFTGLQDLWELDGVVWFRKDMELTEAELSDDALLNLGVILNADQAFVNGELVGQTADSWGKIRSYTIPKSLLKTGLNTIIVRIENYGGDGGFMSNDKLFYLKTADVQHPLSGPWQYQVGYRLSGYDRPEKEMSPNTLPTLMYNNMISPLTDFSIKGVLWYQGESNADRGDQYRDLFPRMIADWRRAFSQGDFPFLYVQLANFHKRSELPGRSYWAELREAQAMTLKVPNTAMTTAIDVGDPANIHPKNKQALGYRLAVLAEKMVYKLLVANAYCPAYQDHHIQGDAITLRFKDVGDGLKTKDKKAVGSFQIAGADHVFYWAEAKISGKNSITVHSDKVPQPVAVRYAWEDNPETANVQNSADLPLLPFRTTI